MSILPSCCFDPQFSGENWVELAASVYSFHSMQKKEMKGLGLERKMACVVRQWIICLVLSEQGTFAVYEL